MIRTRPNMTLGCRIMLVTLLLYFNAPQASPAQTLPLQAFFQGVVEHYDPEHLPNSEQVMKAIHQVDSMSSEDIVEALPSVLAAFRHRDDSVKGYAALAMVAIGQRSDGPVLLRPYEATLTGGLSASKASVQKITLVLLDLLRTELQAGTLSTVVDFVSRRDRDSIAQTAAICLLLKAAPNRGDAIQALQDFASRPLDHPTKEALLNGIANSSTENVVAVDILIAAFEDPEESIRFQAVQGFQRMPRSAVMRAKSSLERLIARPDENLEVKTAAADALRRAG